MTLKKKLFICLGSFCLCMGIIGIVVPGLPTTPFLLLAAALYTKSSEKLYQKLISHKLLGKYIREYRQNQGMTRGQKIWAICLMWTMISISCLFLIESLHIGCFVVGAGLIGSFVMGFWVPNAKK